jgi:hypothetical protein
MFGGACTQATTDYLSRVFILHQYRVRVSLTWPGLVFYILRVIVITAARKVCVALDKSSFQTIVYMCNQKNSAAGTG